MVAFVVNFHRTQLTPRGSLTLLRFNRGVYTLLPPVHCVSAALSDTQPRTSHLLYLTAMY